MAQFGLLMDYDDVVAFLEFATNQGYLIVSSNSAEIISAEKAVEFRKSKRGLFRVYLTKNLDKITTIVDWYGNIRTQAYTDIEFEIPEKLVENEIGLDSSVYNKGWYAGRLYAPTYHSKLLSEDYKILKKFFRKYKKFGGSYFRISPNLLGRYNAREVKLYYGREEING